MFQALSLRFPGLSRLSLVRRHHLGREEDVEIFVVPSLFHPFPIPSLSPCSFHRVKVDELSFLGFATYGAFLWLLSLPVGRSFFLAIRRPFMGHSWLLELHRPPIYVT